MSTFNSKTVRLRRAACITTFGVLIASLSTAAHAEDPKVYPATMCHEATNPPLATPLILHTTGGIVNLSRDRYTYVVCPIVTDNPFSTRGYNDAYVRYTYASGLPNPILCALSSFSPWSAAAYVQYKTGPAGPNELRFDPSPASYRQGHYQLLCLMPSSPAGRTASQLFSYRFDEND